MKALSAALILAGGLASISAHADSVTLDAIASGWYAASGWHDAVNSNYAVGGGIDGNTRNDFFIFDLSGLSGAATAVTLKIFNPGVAPSPGVLFGYTSSDTSETYVLSEVSTEVGRIVAGYSAGSSIGQSIYTDLGGGTIFGEYQASLADNGQFISINLNAAGLSAINNGNGRFAFGGSVTTLDGVINPESIFASTILGPGAVQLVVTTVPEPESAALLLAGLLLVGPWVKRRKHGTD